MHRQHDLVPLGHAQHLLGHDLAGHSLTDVLHDLPAVDAYRQPLGGVDHLKLAGVGVGHLAQAGVLDVQPVGQCQTLAGHCADQPHSVKLHGLASQQRLERVTSGAPELSNAERAAAVGIDDALGLLQRDLDPSLGLEEHLQLDVADAIARTQYHGLADLALGLGHVLHADAVNLCGHELVHIVLVAERLHQILLPGQPRQHSRFDLRRVAIDHHVALGGPDGFLDLASVRAARRQVLQVYRILARPTTRMSTVVTQRNRKLAATSHPNKTLRTSFLQCGFIPESGSHQRLYSLIFMLLQRLERFVCFGKCPCRLFGGGADLGGGLDAQ